ncbi:MAG: acyl-CoA dehydrogenase family protein [Deltaproteobacteria bacterium]|nr:acyl-CoA dehydrogenase family protein [Deltaproteobacteria bacterium]MBW2052887.1 acyl-CoA dehydrogenase family protein [Deltaproteobacteria bacterium]MBW2141409.1 acyl-CoA dehydrogenase family protein [Deltaproteobacteria bacterium]MBW2324013.1 acyl-CoA dehydrogenase family protein [Deltaproteobacteria bacterium]
MDFEMSMEQEILQRTVREFAEKEIRPVARELDEKEEFSIETCQAMGDLGLFGMFVDEAYGGQGMDYISYIISVEEIARVDGSHAATVAAGNSLGIGPIYYYGNEEQKKRYLPDLCSGRALWGFGLTEAGAGSDAGSPKTTAILEGDTWVVNGSKIFITNASAPITKGVTVLAKTGTREDGRTELSCILAEQDTPGFEAREMHGKMMWRSSNTSELFFDDCRIPRGNLLGTQGHGFHQMLETLDGGRLSIAAMGVGGAQGAFDLAKRYAMERVQFGRPIGSFQVNAFKLADMALEIEAARLLLYKACWLRDNNKSFSKLAAMAKLYASEVMGRVVNEAVQLHGGYGLMKEYEVERFYRDQKLLTIGEGTSEIQRLVIARLIGII